MIKRITILVVTLFCFWTWNVQAEISEFKITASDGEAFDLFGQSASIDGDYAIVGANQNDVSGSNSGSAYIFKRNGNEWIEETRLSASDGSEGDMFGRSVAIDGEYAVIGTYPGVSSKGAAYIFKKEGTSWTQQAKLTAADGQNGDFFGYTVAIDGEYAAVSGHGYDGVGSNSGSVYIFKRDGTSWSEQAKLTASDAADSDIFGRHISIDGDSVLIGAFQDDVNGNASGSAYLFQREGVSWTEQAKLTASDGGELDNFGERVSLSGDYAAITAMGDDDKGSGAGAVYIFKRENTTWTQQTKLTASDGVSGDYFGYSISINGDHLLIGSYSDNGNGAKSGSVYIFELEAGAWNEKTKLAASDGAENDYFSNAISIGGDYAILGAFRDDALGEDSGSAYLYKFKNTATITLSPDNTVPVTGDSLCVDVNIADSNGLYSAAFDLTYNPDELEYQSASEGNFLNADSGETFFNASLLNDDPSNGILVIGVSRVADIGEISGSGTIATACFTVTGGSGGDITIGLDNGYFEGSEPGTGIVVVEGDDPVIPVEIGVPQNLTVTDPATLDRLDLSWDAAPDASGYEIYRSISAGGTFELLGTTTGTTYQDNDCILTNVSYYYKVKAISSTGGSTGEFSNEASGSAAGIAGDINKDNRVDGRDLTILARAFNTVPGDTDYNCQANLDRTGAIDGDDLVELSTSFGDRL